MLVMMKKTCRPAWPNSGSCASASKVAAMNTVNSSTLPTMPTGQAQTRRRRPPTAEANPKRVAEDLAPGDRVAGDGQLGVVERGGEAHAGPFRGSGAVGEQALDVLGDHVDLEVDGVAGLLEAERGAGQGLGDQARR